MPYHVCAYTTAIGAVADTDVPALNDDILTIQNTHFVLSKSLWLLASMVLSPTIIRARLTSPTLRQIASIYLRGINAAAIPGNNPYIYFTYGGGTQLRPFEEIQVLGTAAPGTTERFTALMFLTDGIVQQPIGDLYPVRFTSTGTAVANAWTTIAIATTDVLPSGIYTMCQSEHISTNAIAHRWIISNQTFRPGFPSMTANTNRLPDQIIFDQFGQMGQFRSNDLPRLQVLCNAADASHEGYLWVMRTGNLS